VVTIEIRQALPSEYDAVGELTVAAYSHDGYVRGDYARTLRAAADRAAKAELEASVIAPTMAPAIKLRRNMRKSSCGGVQSRCGRRGDGCRKPPPAPGFKFNRRCYREIRSRTVSRSEQCVPPAAVFVRPSRRALARENVALRQTIGVAGDEFNAARRNQALGAIA